MKCPVIAVKSGGPLETVAHGQTGFLCRPDPEEFAAAMREFVEDRKLQGDMGQAGHDRVVTKFSFDAFATQLNIVINNLVYNLVNRI